MKKSFLSESQMSSLVEAICEAENHTSGEIRVHIDATTPKDNAAVAFAAFTKLGMQNTKERNGVLFHVNFEQKYLTIIGDEGIHEKVRQQFWDNLHDNITAEFAQGRFYEALKEAILKTGQELKNYFPIQEGNPNELSNEITFS
ncbi:TPM domain-containing protein [Chryseobacterium sp. A301]